MFTFNCVIYVFLLRLLIGGGGNKNFPECKSASLFPTTKATTEIILVTMRLGVQYPNAVTVLQ